MATITTTANMKTVLLQAEIAGKLESLLAITNTDNVYYKDGDSEVKLTAKLAEIIASISSLPTDSNVDTKIKTATDTLYNKIMGTTDGTTTVNEAYDTLKEVADYLTEHGSVVQGFTNDISSLKDSVKALQDGMTKVEASDTNGNVKVNGEEVSVYRHPATHSADLITDTATKVIMTADERTKLSGIADNASAIVSGTGAVDDATPVGKLMLQIIE
jgi:phage-related protein